MDAMHFLDGAAREAFDMWQDTKREAITSARLRSFQVRSPLAASLHQSAVMPLEELAA